ncbi:hypothetical protein HRbin12_00200 [bacterium HR12]|nr:hypothetical protein HRbin12_00200 [bacterium HR12]
MRVAGIVLVLALLSGCTGPFRRAAGTLEDTPAPSPTAAATPLAPRGDIRIRSPLAGDDVLSPVVVRGVASSESGEVLVRVVDAAGTELAAMEVPIGCGAGCRGRFEARLAFYVPSRSPGTVQALEVAADGTVLQAAEVPVTLVPGA